MSAIMNPQQPDREVSPIDLRQTPADADIELPGLKALGGDLDLKSSRFSLLGRSVSFREELLKAMTQKDIEAFKGLLVGDPRLEAFTPVFLNAPDITKPKERSDHISRGIAAEMDIMNASGLSLSDTGGKSAVEFIKFYHGYLAPFPDKSETEDATSLFKLATQTPDPEKRVNLWDVVINFDKHGNVLGAASGQLIPGGTAWNEHTWRYQDDVLRHSKVGTAAFNAFERNFGSLGAERIMIEADNPFALSEQPVSHDLARPQERRQYWSEEGQSMDPYDRFGFWGDKHNFNLLVSLVKQTDASTGQVTYKPVAANNSQVALSGNDNGCSTICSLVRDITNDERQESKKLGILAKDLLLADVSRGVRLDGISISDIVGGMPKEMFGETYAKMQATIDDNYAASKEYTQAIADLARSEEILVQVSPLSSTGLAAMRNRADELRKTELAGEAGKTRGQIRRVAPEEFTPENPLIPQVFTLIKRVGEEDVVGFDVFLNFNMQTQVYRGLRQYVTEGGDLDSIIGGLRDRIGKTQADEGRWRNALNDEKEWNLKPLSEMNSTLQLLGEATRNLPEEQKRAVIDGHLHENPVATLSIFAQTKGDEVIGFADTLFSTDTGNTFIGYSATKKGADGSAREILRQVVANTKAESTQWGVENGFIATEFDPRHNPDHLEAEYRIRHMGGFTDLPVDYTQPVQGSLIEMPLALFVLDHMGRSKIRKDEVLGLANDMWGKVYFADEQTKQRLTKKLADSMTEDEYPLQQSRI